MGYVPPSHLMVLPKDTTVQSLEQMRAIWSWPQMVTLPPPDLSLIDDPGSDNPDLFGLHPITLGYLLIFAVGFLVAYVGWLVMR